MTTPRGLPPEQPPVHTITSAPPSLSADQARRQRSYLLQMAVRVLCFVGAVLSFHHVPLAVTIVLVVGAVVLPYTAVLVANAGRERQDRDASFLDPRLIGGAPGPEPAQGTRSPVGDQDPSDTGPGTTPPAGDER